MCPIQENDLLDAADYAPAIAEALSLQFIEKGL
jgi:hypothetical protein